MEGKYSKQVWRQYDDYLLALNQLNDAPEWRTYRKYLFDQGLCIFIHFAVNALADEGMLCRRYAHAKTETVSRRPVVQHQLPTHIVREEMDDLHQDLGDFQDSSDVEPDASSQDRPSNQ